MEIEPLPRITPAASSDDLMPVAVPRSTEAKLRHSCHKAAARPSSPGPLEVRLWLCKVLQSHGVSWPFQLSSESYNLLVLSREWMGMGEWDYH